MRACSVALLFVVASYLGWSLPRSVPVTSISVSDLEAAMVGGWFCNSECIPSGGVCAGVVSCPPPCPAPPAAAGVCTDTTVAEACNGTSEWPGVNCYPIPPYTCATSYATTGTSVGGTPGVPCVCDTGGALLVPSACTATMTQCIF